MNFTGSFKNWSDILFASAASLLTKLAGILPNIIGALLLLLLGWLIAKLFKKISAKMLKWTGLERAMVKSRITDTFKSVGVTTTISDTLSIIIFWLTFLVFMVSASEVLGLSIVLTTLNSAILYVPNLIAAIAIIVLALFLARFVKDIISVALAQINMIYARPLARTVELLIIVFGIVLAMTQLGFDIGLLMANMTIFIGGFVAIVVLSLGLGAKTVVENLLAGYYVRQLFKKGQEVTLLGEKGEIKQINNMGIVLETSEGDISVPHGRIIEKGSFKS
ncbi:MAG: hypothetical protein U9R17_06280 [Thermodesulfobacteriota bacterium]|nr:hypothetical protein [Thermodesulfobacteriota bacterium]